MVYEDVDEILVHCQTFDWENTFNNLFHAEDTLNRLDFVDRAVLYLDEMVDEEEDEEDTDSAVVELLDDIVDYRNLISEFADSFVSEEDSPYELFQDNEYVREIEDELRTIADDIVKKIALVA